MKSIYKRIIIKVSGEALSNESEHSIFDRTKLEMIADVVEQIHGLGVNIGIVTGAGNIWWGRTADVDRAEKGARAFAPHRAVGLDRVLYYHRLLR